MKERVYERERKCIRKRETEKVWRRECMRDCVSETQSSEEVDCKRSGYCKFQIAGPRTSKSRQQLPAQGERDRAGRLAGPRM